MEVIAIVSAGVRFPGARNLDEFWAVLKDGKDLSSTLSALSDRVGSGPDSVFHDRAYVCGAEQVSPLGLDLDPEGLEALDPLLHLTIAAGREAFYGSRFASVNRQRVSVILGSIALPTESSAALALNWLLAREDSASKRLNLTPASLPAHILSAALGLGGSRYTLDAACASSLYALKLACDDLREARADLVLAGGVCRPDIFYTQIGFSALDALSKGGVCHSLDARADGLMVGEGAGIFALKRLSDAEAHGDRILGLIRGAGLSNDRDGGLMAPSSEGQLRAMQAAYQQAGWAPDSVGLIECHATGTPLGDKVEFQSLKTLWSGSAKRAVLGSVKPNVGHMLTAAGSAGIAKLLLAFQHRTLPPTANFRAAPADWLLAQSPFAILSEARPWSGDEPRRAAISGFGFGGINAHLLLEEYQPGQKPDAAFTQGSARKVALVAASSLPGPGPDGFQIGYKQFRIPPKELQDILPQQIMALLAADGLARENAPKALESGCFVGLEMDPQANLYSCRWRLPEASFVPPLDANRVMGSLGSIVASRVAREWGIGGPAFPVAMNEASGLKALELAVQAISRGELNAALVLAVDVQSSNAGQKQFAQTEAEHWPSADDRALALWLVAEDALQDQKAIAVFAADAFAPRTGVQAWVEDIKRRPEWMHHLGLKKAQLSETHAYLGTAHGLASLLDALKQGDTEHLIFRDRHEHSSSVTWTLGEALPDIKTKARFQGPGFSIARWDQLPWLALHASPPEHTLEPLPSQAVEKAPRFRPELARLLLQQEHQTIDAHHSFLQFRREADQLVQDLLQGRNPQSAAESPESISLPTEAGRRPRTWVSEAWNTEPALYDYAACQEFAEGKIARVFGSRFADIDSFRTRVRLPSERLLLCHRVMSISGEALSLGSGTMVTEHDVFPDAWYLDDGFMPTAIAVESGQADLMLSAFLGADFKTRGEAVYRLLDARVAFAGSLPKVGDTIRYEIQIHRFFEQGGTLFFHFSFEASIAGRPLMSMRDGCAGFFTEAALSEGRGVRRSQLQLQARAGQWTGGYEPLRAIKGGAYSEAQIDALRSGDLSACFGPDFADLPLKNPTCLPEGDLRLVHRIRELEARGGRFGIGRIYGEADIHPDDWFLTCHFTDDPVMPGTLMYECCLHTLRIFLLSAGWVFERDAFHHQPIPGRNSQLKCRGQVLPTTRLVGYEIEIKEMGYGPEPYVICDALMYADGKAIVDITDMTLYIPGCAREDLEAIWASRSSPKAALPTPAYTYEQILGFSNGRPSTCFGEVYRVFDGERKIARLPRPPFQFLDRVEWVDGPLMQQHVGTRLEASYDLPDDAWYWAANGDRLPFSVLVEIALQPCGFMAAYMGSALLSSKDLKFRNLSGEAVCYRDIRKGDGSLRIAVSSTKLARTGDMIIQDYKFLVSDSRGPVYEGSTSFGFFTEEALDQQAGIRQEKAWQETMDPKAYPEHRALPKPPLAMVDLWESRGSRILGAKRVRPEEWFFEAHFYEDPVMPGSLGLESLMQLLAAEGTRCNPAVKAWRVALNAPHQWIYRGQVRPRNKQVNLALTLREAQPESLLADGVLYCDELAIYRLDGLRIEAVD